MKLEGATPWVYGVGIPDDAVAGVLGQRRCAVANPQPRSAAGASSFEAATFTLEARRALGVQWPLCSQHSRAAPTPHKHAPWRLAVWRSPHKSQRMSLAVRLPILDSAHRHENAPEHFPIPPNMVFEFGCSSVAHKHSQSKTGCWLFGEASLPHSLNGFSSSNVLSRSGTAFESASLRGVVSCSS